MINSLLKHHRLYPVGKRGHSCVRNNTLAPQTVLAERQQPHHQVHLLHMWVSHLQRTARSKLAVIPQFNAELFTVQDLAHDKMLIALLVLQYSHILLLVMPFRSHCRRLVELLVQVDTRRSQVEVELNVLLQAQQTHVVEEGALVVVLVDNPLLHWDYQMLVLTIVLDRVRAQPHVSCPATAIKCNKINISRRSISSLSAHVGDSVQTALVRIYR